jgi:endonuclease/exonuclease/phosphatase family metal-dependent hydrolase
LEACKNEAFVVVGGDFNDDFSAHDGIRSLWSSFHGFMPKLTCKTTKGLFNFDHVLVRGGTSSLVRPCLRADESIPNTVCPSDHVPVLVHVEFVKERLDTT